MWSQLYRLRAGVCSLSHGGEVGEEGKTSLGRPGPWGGETAALGPMWCEHSPSASLPAQQWRMEESHQQSGYACTQLMVQALWLV